MNTKIKLISFDIWDTILKRKCHPEEVKLYTAKYIYLKYNDRLKEEYKDIYKILLKRDEIEAKFVQEKHANGKDDEYRIFDVFVLLQKEIFVSGKKDEAMVNEWIRVEVNREKEVTYLNPDIIPIFEKYKKLRMCCISDFYMSKEHLMEILENVNPPVKFEKVFSSADYLLNKKSGNLYKVAEKELHIKPEEHLHVGDNAFSDIAKANELGIETIKIERGSQYFEPKRQRDFHFSFAELKKDCSKMESRLYNLGLELSPLLYFYVYRIVEYAIINKIDIIYYFTREGEKFIKVHELISQTNSLGITVPHSMILEVSRMATFGASLKDFSITELLRLWSQYRVQSMKALFQTLSINIDPFQEYMHKYAIDIDEDINEPWFNVKVQKLFNDEEFRQKVNVELKHKKEELQKYFLRKKITNDGRTILGVDIGWRGTIQDNLAYIFDKDEFIGYYFALFDFYNVQPTNTTKIKYIKSQKVIQEDVAPTITIFEMLFSPNTGSVIEYKNGNAVRKIKKEELQIIQDYISFIQQGMEDGAKVVNEYVKIHPFEASEFDEYIENMVTNIRKNPNKDLLDVYYKLVMNDTFGTGKYFDKRGSKLSILNRLNVFKCRKQIKKEWWKEAYIKYNHLEYLQILVQLKASLRKFIRRIKGHG